VLDALQGLGPVGRRPGRLLGRVAGLAGLGVPVRPPPSPRVRAAVLGLGGGGWHRPRPPRGITVPVGVPRAVGTTSGVPRDQSLALFDALGSAEKTLHANPGKHGEVPAFEGGHARLRFFARQPRQTPPLAVARPDD